MVAIVMAAAMATDLISICKKLDANFDILWHFSASLHTVHILGLDIRVKNVGYLLCRISYREEVCLQNPTI
jgi:hypothetical protein